MRRPVTHSSDSDTSHESAQQIAARIASLLNETDPTAQTDILRIVTECGPAFAERQAAKAVDIYQSGGLLTHDKSRSRTLGGTFFYLVRTHLKYRHDRKLWRQRANALRDVFPRLAPSKPSQMAAQSSSSPK